MLNKNPSLVTFLLLLRLCSVVRNWAKWNQACNWARTYTLPTRCTIWANLNVCCVSELAEVNTFWKELWCWCFLNLFVVLLCCKHFQNKNLGHCKNCLQLAKTRTLTAFATMCLNQGCKNAPRDQNLECANGICSDVAVPSLQFWVQYYSNAYVCALLKISARQKSHRKFCTPGLNRWGLKEFPTFFVSTWIPGSVELVQRNLVSQKTSPSVHNIAFT